VRELTVFFSDIAGFTGISEKIVAARTRRSASASYLEMVTAHPGSGNRHGGQIHG